MLQDQSPNAAAMGPGITALLMTGLVQKGKLSSGPGPSADARVSQATASPSAQPTGHHRGDGSRPSGNSRNANGYSPWVIQVTQLASQAVARPPGSPSGATSSA